MYSMSIEKFFPRPTKNRKKQDKIIFYKLSAMIKLYVEMLNTPCTYILLL